MSLKIKWQPGLLERAYEAIGKATPEAIDRAMTQARDLMGALPVQRAGSAFLGKARGTGQLTTPHDDARVLPTITASELTDVTSMVAAFLLAKIEFDDAAITWILAALEGSSAQDNQPQSRILEIVTYGRARPAGRGR